MSDTTPEQLRQTDELLRECVEKVPDIAVRLAELTQRVRILDNPLVTNRFAVTRRPGWDEPPPGACGRVFGADHQATTKLCS